MTAEVSLVIAEGTGPSLLGQDWLREIWLNWQYYYYIQRYGEIFKDELDTFKGFKVRMHIDPEATSYFNMPSFCFLL